jgi:hypothetical protein
MTTQAKRITLWGLFLAVAFVLGLYLSAATKVADAADKAAQGPAEGRIGIKSLLLTFDSVYLSFD